MAHYYNIEINVLITDTHQTPAYPSGHTMYAELAAHMLSDMYPEHKKTLGCQSTVDLLEYYREFIMHQTTEHQR